jgi:hypothetical protein
MFVVGSLRDRGTNALVDAATKTFDGLIETKILAGVAALEVQWVCAKGAADSMPEAQFDEVVERTGALQDVLRNGLDARPRVRPYDVLVLLGHSNAAPSKAPECLRFDFDRDAPEAEVAIKEMAPYLPPTLRAIVLLNCRSADYAVQFLPFAEFVVAARPMLRADTAMDACQSLFRGLLGVCATG